MADLQSLLSARVDDGTVPGAVALVAHGDGVEVAAVGSVDVEGSAPMRRDTIFRLASITKPIAAAAVMALVDDGRLGLDDPIGTWLPELAAPQVLRAPDAPLEDVVPAVRPITVFDVLTSRAGWGLPSTFEHPVVARLFAEIMPDPLRPSRWPAPDVWLAALARIPLLYQPGDGWLYNTCSDIQAVLAERVTGRPFPEYLAERLLAPIGMRDTGFHVPIEKVARLASLYESSPSGDLGLLDPADGAFTAAPAFPSGAGGLVSTVDDWLAFGRMLLAGGLAADGTRALSADAVRLMMTDHLTQTQRAAAGIFLEDTGWGFGGSVDLGAQRPWNVPGRYGWVGGSGTTAYVVPSTGTVTMVMTQVALTRHGTTSLFEEVFRYAVGA